jgi:aspartate/methionine/tyrosine aminotransferase
MDGLRAMGVPYVRPRGGFFMIANISATGLGSLEFCRRLLSEAQVAVFPGALTSSRDDAIRMSWLVPVERIREGLRRMQEFVRQLQAG